MWRAAEHQFEVQTQKGWEPLSPGLMSPGDTGLFGGFLLALCHQGSSREGPAAEGHKFSLPMSLSPSGCSQQHEERLARAPGVGFP